MTERENEKILGLMGRWETLTENTLTDCRRRKTFLKVLTETYGLLEPFVLQEQIPKTLLPLLRRIIEFAAVCMPENAEEAATLACVEALAGMVTGEAAIYSDPRGIFPVEYSFNGITYFFPFDIENAERSFAALCLAILQ